MPTQKTVLATLEGASIQPPPHPGAFHGGPPPFRPVEPHRAEITMTLAILGLFIPITAVIALVYASEDVRKMNAGTMDRSGLDKTNAARGIAVASLVLSVLGMFMLLALIIV